MVRGQAAEVAEPADLQRLRTLPLYPWAPGANSHYVRIQPDAVTGRRIVIPADPPFTWWANGATKAVRSKRGRPQRPRLAASPPGASSPNRPPAPPASRAS
jgi:hypothetical protein